VAGTAGYEAFANPSRPLPAGPKLLSEGRPPVTRHSAVLTTDILLGDPRWEKLVRELMLEVIAAANALDFEVSPSLADENINRTRIMGAYKASTLIDFERGQPLELENMFLEPLRQAQTAGVPVPHLLRLCEVLHQLDPAR
jgi:2-dehydropantoate 2-reductase